jgi:hypothetical protein
MRLLPRKRAVKDGAINQGLSGAFSYPGFPAFLGWGALPLCRHLAEITRTRGRTTPSVKTSSCTGRTIIRGCDLTDEKS